MGDALSAVLALRKEKQTRDLAQAKSIESGFNNFATNFLAAKKLNQDSKPSLTDQFLELGKVREVAVASRNAPLLKRVDSALEQITGQSQNPNAFIASGAAQGQAVQQQFPQLNQQQAPATPGTSSGIPQAKFDPFTGDQIPESEAEIEIAKQATAQGAKAAELAGRDIFRASAALDTTFDTALNFGTEQLEKLGTRPGQAFGFIDKLTPSQFNKFKDAYVGASREAASLVARQLIPGVRAASITKIFAESTSKLGSTIEASSENVSASMGNAYANAVSQNIDVVDEATGNKAKIQDLLIDAKTGRQISGLGFQNKTRAINDLKRNFARSLADDLNQRAFKRDPRLFKPSERRKLIEGFPSFASEAEGDKSVLPGKLYTVIGNDGKLQVLESDGGI